MALIGNFEARLQHFKRLWEFCYPKAKILITGRPNFFLDDTEKRLSLGISQPTGDNHYCEAIRLAPFSIKQIEKSLRQQKSEIREQISTVAKNNSRFRDLVARPSLLHVVSVIWEKENLGDQIENLNSAYVMERFVKYSYRRQGLKAGNYKDESRKYFMALNTSEREYFMSGIAAYMASKKLGNQISAGELNNLIENLINVIPDSVSTSVPVILGEERRPLKIRMAEDSQEYIEHIKTDVRTCGLLVDDPAVPGTFKFGHKSFMEYLFASIIGNLITDKPLQGTQAILKTTKANISNILDFPVSLEFLSEIIIQKKPSIGNTDSEERQQFYIAQILFDKCHDLNKSSFFYTAIKNLTLICTFFIFFEIVFYQKYRYLRMLSFLSLTMVSMLLTLGWSMSRLGLMYSQYDNIVAAIIMIIGTIMTINYIFIRTDESKKSKLTVWIQLCRKIGFKDEIIHKVIGTWWLPGIKNKKFDVFVFFK